VPDEDVLAGIVFVLRAGIAWEQLPQRFGCGSGMTCWRRLREWQDAGVWSKVRQVLEAGLPDGGGVDWGRAWARAARTRPSRRSPDRRRTSARTGDRSVARHATGERSRPARDRGRAEPP
jgi:transposase